MYFLFAYALANFVVFLCAHSFHECKWLCINSFCFIFFIEHCFEDLPMSQRGLLFLTAVGSNGSGDFIPKN